MMIILAILYVVIGAILGTLYHAFLEKYSPGYRFDDDGTKPVLMGIFWPIGAIMFITYYSYKSKNSK
jgi:glucose uptake protein GlcU